MGDVTGAAYEVSGGTSSGITVSTDGEINCSTCSGNALTTSTPDNLILTFMNPGGPYSSPSPFSYDINAADQIGFNVGAGHYTQLAAGIYTPTWNGSQDAHTCNLSIAIPHP